VAWLVWQLRSYEEDAGGVICQQLAEAVLKVAVLTKVCHFPKEASSDCLQDFVKCYR
jgi:hypothetical protein